LQKKLTGKTGEQAQTPEMRFFGLRDGWKGYHLFFKLLTINLMGDFDQNGVNKKGKWA